MQHKRLRIKVCGTTRVQDAEAAVRLGVDAIGLILHADSPRCISIEQAQSIRQTVPAFVSVVGVFVDASLEQVNHIASQVGLDTIQLHGNEDNEFGRSLNRPFIKAIRARSSDQVSQDINQYPDAQALLLDPYVKGVHGGTGTQLDENLWPSQANKSLILAGGLSPKNLQRAIAANQPYAVDLNSGVESAPGIKDHTLLADAIAIAHY